MDLPPFEHARLLSKAWARGPPRHDLGGSGCRAPSWRERGLGALHVEAGRLDLHAGTELRSRLARRAGFPEEGTLVTAGTSGANLAVLLALLEPGGNVVCERPHYAPLPNLARALGAQVRWVDRRPEEDWRLDPEDVAAACDASTSLVLLTSPSNPTAAVATPADLRRLGDVAGEHGAHVLVDEVYGELRGVPAAATLHPRIVTTAGLNKCWGAPGLRVGWVLAPPELLPRIHEAHLTAVLAPSFSGCQGALALLDHEAECRDELEDRLGRTHPVYRTWAAAHGLPEAPLGLVAFPRVPADDTRALARRALREGVLVLPGECFGRAGHLRIGLGGDPDALHEALDALAALGLAD